MWDAFPDGRGALFLVNGEAESCFTALWKFKAFVAEGLFGAVLLCFDEPSAGEAAHFEGFPFEACSAVLASSLSDFEHFVSFFVVHTSLQNGGVGKIPTRGL